MPVSKYVLLNAEKSFCPKCRKNVTLLCHKTSQTTKPQFYICFYCDEVFEVGRGKVEREEEPQQRSGCI